MREEKDTMFGILFSPLIMNGKPLPTRALRGFFCALFLALGAVSPLPPRANQDSPPPPAPVAFTVNADVDLTVGSKAVLEGSDIEVTLLEAHGPPPGCDDCPNRARLLVRSGNESQELSYTLSGNMPRAMFARARMKEVFGRFFIAVKIIEGGFTLRVEARQE